MTDLEITQFCAEAMGYQTAESTSGPDKGTRYFCDYYDFHGKYDPLHDDAQAMALVKKFRLFITHDETDFWVEWSGPIGGEEKVSWRADQDLNRAICECVAKIEKARLVSAV